MKKILFVLAAMVLLVSSSLGETINWTNPTQYTDGTNIPAAKRAQLSTEIQYRIGSGAYTTFGTATGGVSTFSAAYVTLPGATTNWRARSISVGDNGSSSAWSPDYPFVRGFQAPAAPSVITVQ